MSLPFLNELDGEAFLAILALLLGAGVFVVWIVSSAWRRAAQTEQRARLAGLLVQRGLPTAEIERVLRAAQMTNVCTDPDEEGVDAAADPETQLVQILASNHYGGNDIRKIIEAARRGGGVSPALVARVRALAAQWEDASGIVSMLESDAARSPELRVKNVDAG